MRISRSTDDILTISRLGEAEMERLRRLRDAADPSACPDAEERLYPDPIRGQPPETIAEDVADWKNFVVPDLRTRNVEALERVEADVRNARPSGKRRKPQFEIAIAIDAVDQWYSALNQARLVLQEKYHLPDEHEVLSLERLFARGQWRAYFQSRFYAEIQCWLLELVMRP